MESRMSGIVFGQYLYCFLMSTDRARAFAGCRLMGAVIAGLTVYDMLKAMSTPIVIGDTRLVAKSGGKRDIVP